MPTIIDLRPEIEKVSGRIAIVALLILCLCIKVYTTQFWLQLKLCCMHQCDYCCWYNPAGYCDCPLVMRKKACKSAIKTKERTENKVVTSKAVNNEDL